MTRRGMASAAALGLTLLAASSVSARAQVPEGDSAWVAGDYHAARIAYERALADDTLSVRANYRLAILASWDGRLDSSLALLARARRAEPGDPDVRFYEARVLSWQGEHRAALAKFDSLLLEQPGRTDAALARAQTLAWAGRFGEAESAYEAIIEADSAQLDARAGQAQVAAWRGNLDLASRRYRLILAERPGHVPSLAGLAQVLLWQGRLRESDRMARTALTFEPTNREAGEVRRAVAQARRPDAEFSLGWSHDSDDNTSWWQTAGSSFRLSERVRGFVSAGALEASDPVRDATRISGEAGATVSGSRFRVTAAAGARRLFPDAGASRTEGTYRAAASARLTPRVGAGVGFAHYPFDETALLIGQGLDVDAVDAEIDVTLQANLSLGGGVGYAWLSDDNARRSAVLALTRQLPGHFSAGVYGRALWYEFKGVGYFSPDRFLTGEVRATWTWSNAAWLVRAGGGLGVQQVGESGDAQSEWHLEGRVARRFGLANELALSAGTSNSAVSSTTGAFRYTSATLSLRLGL